MKIVMTQAYYTLSNMTVKKTVKTINIKSNELKGMENSTEREKRFAILKCTVKIHYKKN